VGRTLRLEQNACFTPSSTKVYCFAVVRGANGDELLRFPATSKDNFAGNGTLKAGWYSESSYEYALGLPPLRQLS
ncbi:MAG: hypothetical protein VXZ53_06660, partial [Planctomycetota bacterium]|nr:hypothetical protein [Planctomycetota bacterium]